MEELRAASYNNPKMVSAEPIVGKQKTIMPKETQSNKRGHQVS